MISYSPCFHGHPWGGPRHQSEGTHLFTLYWCLSGFQPGVRQWGINYSTITMWGRKKTNIPGQACTLTTGARGCQRTWYAVQAHKGEWNLHQLRPNPNLCDSRWWGSAGREEWLYQVAPLELPTWVSLLLEYQAPRSPRHHSLEYRYSPATKIRRIYLQSHAEMSMVYQGQ